MVKLTKGRNIRTTGRTIYLKVSAKQTKGAIHTGVPSGTNLEKNLETPPSTIRHRNKERKIGKIIKNKYKLNPKAPKIYGTRSLKKQKSITIKTNR